MTPALRLLLSSSAAFLAAACALWLLRPGVATGQPQVLTTTAQTWALFLSVCGAGWSLTSARGVQWVLPAAAACLAGARAPDTPAAAGTQQKPVRIQATALSSVPLREGGWRIRVTAPRYGGVPIRCDTAARSPPRYGTSVQVCGTLKLRYGRLYISNSQWQALAATQVGGAPPPRDLLGRIQAHVRSLLRGHMGIAQASWGEALLLGHASRAPLYSIYRDLGVLHLLAISGLHFWLWWALLHRLLPRHQVGLRVTLLAGVALLGGFTASITRAGIALLLRELLTMRGWRAPPFAYWACALWCELCLFRASSVSLGLCLSYTATAALLLCGAHAHAVPSRLGQVCIASAAACAITAPLLHAQGASISLFSIPLSPVLGALLPIKLLAVAAGLLPGLGEFAAWILHALEVLEAGLLRRLQSLPGTPWQSASPSVLPMTAACVVSTILLLRRDSRSLAWPARNLLLALVWIAAATPRTHQQPMAIDVQAQLVVDTSFAQTVWRDLRHGNVDQYQTIEIATTQLDPMQASMLLELARPTKLIWSPASSAPHWLSRLCAQRHVEFKTQLSPSRH